jgi:8-oxo-dGTP pyrophosphatase MutT (NUDIX family)
MQKTGVGIVIGRFQVHDLHEGHNRLVEKAFARHGKVLICIGVSARLVTPNDPLDYPTREQMVKEEYATAQVVPLHDKPGNDAAWSAQLDTLVGLLYPTVRATIYYGRGSDVPTAYKGRHPLHEIDEVELKSGTYIREEVAGTVGTNRAWRAGAIYAAHNQWPRVDPVVDIAMLRRRDDGEIEILVGQRAHEQGKLRLPGGHFDTKLDQTGEDAARRELQEETGMEAGPLQYIGQFKVRNGNMLTTLYATHYLHGAAKGSDDLDEVFWLNIKAIGTKTWADSHAMLVTQVQDNARLPS